MDGALAAKILGTAELHGIPGVRPCPSGEAVTADSPGDLARALALACYHQGAEDEGYHAAGVAREVRALSLGERDGKAILY